MTITFTYDTNTLELELFEYSESLKDTDGVIETSYNCELAANTDISVLKPYFNNIVSIDLDLDGISIIITDAVLKSVNRNFSITSNELVVRVTLIK